MLKKLCGAAALALVLLCLAATLVGQVTTGTILGTIHDASGAAVSGAKVTITDNSKGTTTTYQTDETGTYNAPFLIPGTLGECRKRGLQTRCLAERRIGR